VTPAGLKTEGAKVALGQKQLAGGEQLFRGVRLRRVQGIASDYTDLRLRGEKWTAIVGNGFAGGGLTRTTKGASSLQLEVEDPKGNLLRNPLMQEAHVLTLDGLNWAFTKVSRAGRNEPLEMLYEPLLVWKLRQILGPHKAFRDQMTRAEFGMMLAFMVKPHPVFIAPELHKIQPIAKQKQGKEAQAEAETTRAPGIGEGAQNLTVKGEDATPGQINAGDRALRVAASENAPRKARVAMMLALIVESVLGTAAPNWYEIEPASISGFKGDRFDLEESTVGFLRGYEPGTRGAIEVAEANPDMRAYEITQKVQRSSAGLASSGAANYGPWLQEAEEWVEAGPQSSGGEAVGVGPESKRYAFTQSAEETNWKALNRLAGEVRWDFFESAGWLYFLSEPSLLKSHQRLAISDSTPWVIDTGFDYDVGKEVTEMTVEAMARNWAAPPGSAVSVKRHGPADGIYIVSSIDAGLERRDGIAQITLHKPTEPLPEPLAKSKTPTIGGAGTEGFGSGVPAKVQEIISYIDAASAAKTTYDWGGGHASFADPGDDKDCSGFVSGAVHAAGFLSTPLTSGEFANVFPNGEGEWVTIYGDAKHVFMKVKYPDGHWRFAGTGGTPGGGAWVDDSNGTSGASAVAGKTASHPPGL